MKWIDLRDMSSSARLKSGAINGANHLWIVGLPHTHARWQQAIDRLGFIPSPNNKFLLRRVGAEDKNLTAKSFHAVWPFAAYADMPPDKVLLNFSRPAAAKESTDEEKDLRAELNQAKRLGRNAEGHEVYQSAAGRFVYRADQGITREANSMRPETFLYAPDSGALDACADGFVRSLLLGEVQRNEDFERFVASVSSRQQAPLLAALTNEQREVAHEAIDAAVMRFLKTEHLTPNDAYGDANRLYDYMPRYNGASRGKGAMPIPLSVIAQRLLGDTAGKTVVLPNAFDGAAFAFLAEGTKIRAFKGPRDLSARAASLQREGLTWLDDFHHVRESGADAMFFNADPAIGSDGTRLDYRDALLATRSLRPDGRAVIVVAADRADQPGFYSQIGRNFLDRLYRNYVVEDAFDVGRELTSRVGTDAALRVVSIRNRLPQEAEQVLPPQLPVCHSWDEIKSRVDESLARAAVREQESDGIDLEKIVEENKLQRPYIAFSKVGEATTMVPKELQAPLQAFFSEFEANNGPVDAFVERELGFGENTLSKSFSPEQIDGGAMMIARLKTGRGHILGDETGLGKGRELALEATWALKKGSKVIFITNGAHLFSDFARDMRDIGEWGRIRPFVMNADGDVQDIIGNAGVLAEGTSVADMRRTLEANLSLDQLGANVLFTTYSQMGEVDSEKAHWIKNQLSDALLVLDEAHVAAGSDSNVATHVVEMSQIAKYVQYSSATWAANFSNLHIYARALPESINVATLAQTMRRGGEAFSEVFSAMLAREGALIRREHDLSKLEFSVEVDTANIERNQRVADQVSEIMGSIAYTAGDLKRLVTRLSDVNVAALKSAREARQSGARTSVFKSAFGTGSMLYQVHRRVNAALNVDNVVRLATEGVEAGRKPVVVFEDTGEAFVKQALMAQATVDENGNEVLSNVVRQPTIKDLMRRILGSLVNVKIADVTIEDLPDLDEEDAEAEAIAEADAAEEDAPAAPGAPPAVAGEAPGAGGIHAVPAEEGVDATAAAAIAGETGAEVDVAPARRRKRRPPQKWKSVKFWELSNVAEGDRTRFKTGIEEIERRIDGLPDLPINIVDVLRERLAEKGITMGELSGRSLELHPLPAVEGADPRLSAKLYQVVARKKGKVAFNETVRAFNGGTLDALAINRAAATGTSLHASPRFADRRRRQLIESQIPENPRDRIQLYGRVNRFDQESFPWIQVATTGNYGEVRQIMVQNKKLAEMSANVRSSRDNHALVKDVPDLLNPIGREVCRAYLQENPQDLVRLDIDPASLDDKHRDFASLLTSRIPLLRSDEMGPIYDQLYAMFEDAVVEAELAGENPLKPRELDVRATVGEGKLMFGFDHGGLGSAFDGAVFARRLDWDEDVRPMSLAALEGLIRANRERLIESNKAQSTGPHESGLPNADFSVLAKRAASHFDARVRAALFQPEMRKYRKVEDAFADEHPGTMAAVIASMRQMRLRARWLEENLPALVPGRVIEEFFGKEGDRDKRWHRTSVVVDVIPPPDKRESQLARWRILTIAPGEQRARSTSLHAMIGKLIDGHRGPISPRLTLRTDFADQIVEARTQDAEPRGSRRRAEHSTYQYRDFEQAWVGTKSRSALVLTGNMYLASEWAGRTKAGQGIVFTDERGLRHRGVLLQSKFKPEWLRYIPVRLWNRPMIHRFVERLESGEMRSDAGSVGYRVHTSFENGWKATEERSKGEADSIRFIPGTGIVMMVGEGARNRVNAMLRQAQKKIRDKAFNGEKVRPADDPAYVVIKEANTKTNRARRRGDDEATGADVLMSSRGLSKYVVLQAQTTERMHRAIDMLLDGPGLELFVPANTDLGQAARVCIRDYFVEQLRATAGTDEDRRARIEQFLERSARAEAASAAGDAASETEQELADLFARLDPQDARPPEVREPAEPRADGAVPEDRADERAEPPEEDSAPDLAALFAGPARGRAGTAASANTQPAPGGATAGAAVDAAADQVPDDDDDPVRDRMAA